METAEFDGAPPPTQKFTRLTARQREGLDWIRAFHARKGYAPSVRELGDGLHMLSPNAPQQLLKALERKGAIRRDGGLSRTIVLVEEPPAPDELSRLREALRDVLDRMAPIPPEDPGGDVCYAGYWSVSERARLEALLGAAG